jgi:hypothetical protein
MIQCHQDAIPMTQGSAQTAQLVYDAAQELLSGIIGKDQQFLMRAYSGGSRGHKAGVSGKLAARYLHNKAATLSSHLANTPTIEDHGNYKQRGGTLPAGHYSSHYIAYHHSFGECIQLFMGTDARAIHSQFSPRPIPHYRHDDFFIHGSGPKGSDGCIVPANDLERRRLNQAIKDFPGRVVLLVKNVAYQLPAELEGQYA